MRSKSLFFVFLVLGLTFFWFVVRNSPTPRYSIIELGVLPGDTTSWPIALNNRGEVLGYSSSSDEYDFDHHPFLWTESEGLSTFEAPKGMYFGPFDMNDSGEVAGALFHEILDGTDITHASPVAAIYRPGYGLESLGTLGGRLSVGQYINNKGEVLGISNLERTTPPAFAPFLWTREDGMNLAASEIPDSSWRAFPLDISDSGVMVWSERVAGASYRLLVVDGSTEYVLFERPDDSAQQEEILVAESGPEG